MDNKGTWDMGEDGQLRVIVSKHEQIWMHIKNVFCKITKRKLENPQQSKYLLQMLVPFEWVVYNVVYLYG